MPFLTIAQKGAGLYKEKGSKFYAFTYHVQDESEVKAIIDLLWKEHPGACHVCYAFKLGYDGKLYRAADDGEPSNSAGQPILGQINAFGVTQVLVAVVRYYGGTKLGVGGLMHAYRVAAKEALENSEVVEKDIMTVFEVHCSYEQFPVFIKEVKLRNALITRQSLDLHCELEFQVKLEQSESWIAFLQSQSYHFQRIE